MESVCWGNSTVGSNPTLSAILRLRLPMASHEQPAMWYVYMLRSAKDRKLYVGSTDDLRRRLREHETGQCKSTAYRRPLDLEAYVAVKEGTVAGPLKAISSQDRR